jgi:hypothetical protein
MQLRCKHKERLENKEVFPSPWEQMSESGRERVEPLPWMFRKKVVLTFICNECGRRRTQADQSMEGPI